MTAGAAGGRPLRERNLRSFDPLLATPPLLFSPRWGCLEQLELLPAWETTHRWPAASVLDVAKSLVPVCLGRTQGWASLSYFFSGWQSLWSFSSPTTTL